MLTSTDQVEALKSIGLSSQPVAIAFLSRPPAGLERISSAAAAGCGYWKLASDGLAFYTNAQDHENCPVGAFTHGVTLPPQKAEELQSLVATMVELKYLKNYEVPAIPHRSTAMEVAAYAPLDRASFAPDVVIFRGNARQIMLLSEAARAADAFDNGMVMGRPACAAIAQALVSGGGVASIGCIGNRVYTELGDDELYLVVSGRSIDATLGQLATIVNANRELEKFHRQRQAALAPASPI